jgi:hypothetical protein
MVAEVLLSTGFLARLPEDALSPETPWYMKKDPKVISDTMMEYVRKEVMREVNGISPLRRKR